MPGNLMADLWKLCLLSSCHSNMTNPTVRFSSSFFLIFSSLPFCLLKIYFLCVWVFCLHTISVYPHALTGAYRCQKGTGPPGTGVINCSEQPCWCWEATWILYKKNKSSYLPLQLYLNYFWDWVSHYVSHIGLELVAILLSQLYKC